MPKDRRLPEVCEPFLSQPNEWLEVEERVKLLAFKFAKKARSHTDGAGRPVEITATELINHGWACLAAQKPAYDPSQGLYKYFWRRIEDKYKQVCRRAENRVRHIPIDEAITLTDGTKKTVVFLQDPIDPRTRIEARDELQKLLDWLAHRHPDLYRLARVMDRYGDMDPDEQAFRLCLPREQVYEMRRRLKVAAVRFLKLKNK